MEAKKKYSWDFLDNCSYRALQQIAKSLCLPCNFKKIYLKELILAKNVKTEKELNERINFIKLERKNLSARKKLSRRKTSIEKSNLRDKEKSKIQENLILSPPISLTPKRTHIPRRSSPRFKDLFIRYRPKTLIGRNTTPKTYSSPRDKNRILKVKHEIDERRIKNKQNDLIFKDEVFNDVNDVFNQSLNNDVTPIALQDELYPEDLVNICEVLPPIKSRIMNVIYPSTSQGSYFEEHIKNVSEIRELVSNSQTKEEFPLIEDNSIIIENTGFMDRINSFINRLSLTPESDIKIDTNGGNKITTDLPKFAEAFGNICNLPWTAQMQDNESKQQNIINTQESNLNFPDEFGFQNIYKTEENNHAMDLLESYLDSPEEVGASLNISELVDQVLGQIDRNTDIHNVLEDFTTVQCVICSRTGPINSLEEHIKEKHSSMMHIERAGGWAVRFSLGELACRQTWRSAPLQRDQSAQTAQTAQTAQSAHSAQSAQTAPPLYLLSACYRDPDCCMATLSILSTKPTIKNYGSITLYNSLTGEPHSWEGEIEPFSTNLPYYNENSGLKIKLEKLNLLPNSANLKLINRELVNSSLSKVIVGQPELNNVNLTFFVSVS